MALAGKALAAAALLVLPLGAAELGGWRTTPGPLPGGSAGPATSEATTIVVDASGLPASTGWFLDAVDSPVAQRVSVTYHERVVMDHASDGAAMLLAFPGQALRFSTGAVGDILLGVHAAGQGLDCCDLSALEDALGAQGGADGNGTQNVTVHAGDELYVGLAAVDWHPASTFLVVLQGRGLTLHHIGTGARVWTFDLVDRARAAGTDVRVLNTAAGAPGTGRFDFDAAEGALFSVAGIFAGGASGRLVATLPNGTTLDAGDAEGFHLLMGSAGPGPVELALDHLDEGTTHPQPPNPGLSLPWAWAPGIAADIPLPVRDTRVVAPPR